MTDAVIGGNKTDYYAKVAERSHVYWHRGRLDQAAAGTAAIPIKADKLTANLPQHTLSVTGSGVTHTTGQWCIAYASGTSACIKDEGTYPAQNGVAGGLALQGNTLYDLTANGSSWVVDSVFTKK